MYIEKDVQGIVSSLLKATILVAAFGTLMGACESATGFDEGQKIVSDTTACRTAPTRDRRFKRIITEGYVRDANDVRIRYKQYEHIGNDAAYMIFIDGFADFIEKYEFLFTAKNEYPGPSVPRNETLADLPITFFSLDLVGHGESDGLPSHVDDADEYVENVLALINGIPKLKAHRRPIIVASHSMGGLVAMRFAESHPEFVDALVLSSPMWGIQEPPGVPAGILRDLSNFYVAAGLSTLCAMPDGIEPLTLAAMAACQTDPTLNACFNDPSLPMCGALTMCLLQGLPNDCGLPPIDFAGLSALFQSFYLMPPGCHTMPDAKAACTFPGPDFNGTTTDYDFCVWSESHPPAGPNATFGWLAASYDGIDDMIAGLAAVAPLGGGLGPR